VAADAPENRLALFARSVDSAEKMAQILGGEDVGERIEIFCEGAVRDGGFAKSRTLTLLLRDASGYVCTAPRVIGGME